MSEYWNRVSKSRPLTCTNCGHTVIVMSQSSTGYTHKGSWEGIRCEGSLTGATPVKR